MEVTISKFTKVFAVALTALSLGVAAPAANASVSVVLPPGVTQTSPTTFDGGQRPCRSITTIAGYVFRCADYYRGGQPDANSDGVADDSAIGLWFLMGTPFGEPVLSISVDTTVGGTVNP